MWNGRLSLHRTFSFPLTCNKTSLLFLQATKHQAVCFLCSFCLLVACCCVHWSPIADSRISFLNKQLWHLWTQILSKEGPNCPSQIWTKQLFLIKPKVETQEISLAWRHASNALQGHRFLVLNAVTFIHPDLRAGNLGVIIYTFLFQHVFNPPQILKFRLWSPSKSVLDALILLLFTFPT